MTALTNHQCTAIAQASNAGLPYAVWRVPGGDAFSLIIATSPAFQAPVFGPRVAPAFALAAFDAPDGNIAWHLPADIVVTDTLAYRHGADFTPEPATNAQSAFAELPATGAVRAAASDLADPAPTARADYETRVARTVAAIRSGQAEKVVMSRIEPRPLAGDHDLRDLVQALARAHPNAFVSLVSSDISGTWLTATPEVLLANGADGVRTMALAGTQWPDPDQDISALIWPAKIVEEQGIVAQEVRAAFADAGIANVIETLPATVRAANLCHLRSDFHAPAATPRQLGDLLRRLHPTSGVCGMPPAAARDIILAEEGPTRGFYTGYLGPVALDGETRLMVNLRSARITPTQAFLHVGGGIVAASDPALEYVETVEKTRTIAQVL